ncbi:MAG: sulfatase-like hydrolase/transferase [Pirellulales bacterium]|nr:sulfatase-like hydrolase/transferase [Pirellulales bacterium]
MAPFFHRIRLLGVGTLLLASVFLFIASSADAVQKGPPNIVLIMADDFGYECLTANGGTSYKTPELDKLAAEGFRCEHCYSQPLCTPTRVQLMTGIYNVRNYVRFGYLDPKATTFANLFKKAGYATCVAGKWQLLGGYEGPKHFGFDEYCLWQLNRRPSRYPNPGMEINGRQVNYTGGEYGPDVATEYICDFIERKKDQPFLVYYPMILTHCPFEPTPDSADWDPKSKGSKTYKGKAKYFGDMVAYADKLVGRIVAKLEEHGLRENTLVIFTGDNGTDQPVVSRMGDRRVKAGKYRVNDNGTRVPLIVNWPGTVPKGQVSQTLVDFTDFLPTLCQAADVALPKDLAIDGQSFLPQAKGEKGSPRKWVYGWFSRTGDPKKAKVFARNQRYKLFQTGKFLDMRDGYAPVPLDTAHLDPDASAVHEMLQGVLEKYRKHEAARPK